LKAKASSPDWAENAKKRAASEAVKHVRDGYVIGLGSGTTASYAIQEIGRVIQQRNWNVLGVPSSHQAFLLAIDCGIPVTTLNEHSTLDLNIDGVDQVDPDLNMIKGMGGALTREKIVASASNRNVIIADETKLVRKLGVNHPVPLEVLPFAAATASSKIKGLGGKPILRVGTGKVGPVVTDNGNFIIDAWMRSIDNAKELDLRLKSIPGVVETGLFVGLADLVCVGTRNNVKVFSKR
jgi:ribose 5-phosphate isomerase A